MLSSIIRHAPLAMGQSLLGLKFTLPTPTLSHPMVYASHRTSYLNRACSSHDQSGPVRRCRESTQRHTPFPSPLVSSSEPVPPLVSPLCPQTFPFVLSAHRASLAGCSYVGFAAAWQTCMGWSGASRFLAKVLVGPDRVRWAAAGTLGEYYATHPGLCMSK